MVDEEAWKGTNWEPLKWHSESTDAWRPRTPVNRWMYDEGHCLQCSCGKKFVKPADWYRADQADAATTSSVSCPWFKTGLTDLYRWTNWQWITQSRWKEEWSTKPPAHVGSLVDLRKYDDEIKRFTDPATRRLLEQKHLTHAISLTEITNMRLRVETPSVYLQRPGIYKVFINIFQITLAR